MRRLIVLAAGLALFAAGLALFVSGAKAEALSLRIAELTSAPGACHGLESAAPAGERAYFRHLAARLGRDVLACPVADRAAAAKALADGALDAAVLDPAAYAPVAAKTRAILTVRPKGRLNRIPIVAAARADDASAKDLPSLRGKIAVFGASLEAALVVERKALADHGAGAGFFAREILAPDGEAAARLRSGAAGVLVLNAAAWQRLCQGERTLDRPCADLKVVWRGRDRPPMALVVRRDMPDDERFQLIGVHVALHLEAKDAFAWASSFTPNGAEFEPAEAEALAPGGR